MSDDKNTEDGKSESSGSGLDLSSLPIPLKRTGAAIDGIIAAPLEVIQEKFEKRFKKNTDEHIEAVKRVRPDLEIDTDNISVREFDNLQDWAEKARDIGSDEEELAATWRAALEITLDENDNLRIVQAIKNLSYEAIMILIKSDGLKFSIPTSSNHTQYAKELFDRGLVSDVTVYTNILNSIMLFFIFSFGILISFFAKEISPPESPIYLQNYSIILILSIVSIFLLVLVVYSKRFLRKYYICTKFGRIFLESYSRYIEDQSGNK